MARVDGDVRHLVRDGAESSLCGVPRAALDPRDDGDLCPNCVDWLPRRMAAWRRTRN